MLKIVDTKNIRCALIEREYHEDKISLSLDYTDEELTTFLNQLDFEYHSGYGGQELFGIVWLMDNKWLERGEYDGSEWWELKEYPTIPDELYFWSKIKG